MTSPSGNEYEQASLDAYKLVCSHVLELLQSRLPYTVTFEDSFLSMGTGIECFDIYPPPVLGEKTPDGRNCFDWDISVYRAYDPACGYEIGITLSRGRPNSTRVYHYFEMSEPNWQEQMVSLITEYVRDIYGTDVIPTQSPI